MGDRIRVGDLALDAAGRGRVYDSILETIGNTPLVRVRRLCEAEGVDADIMLKLEFFNPIASVKDRIAVSMIIAMESDGRIEPGATIVEPTSGNTGIGLAFVCAARGYRCILTMPDSMSVERQKMLKFLGAEVVLTPREKGIKGAIERAEQIRDETPGAVIPGQFDNPANPDIHRRTTAEEIWRDTEGAVDIIVSGIGTGGTFTGVSDVLKQRNPDLIMIAVEPELSPVLSGGTHSPHVIQGIGAGFIPAVMNTEAIDEIVQVGNEEAVTAARRLATLEGIPGGISSGAAVAAALRVAKRAKNAGKRIVTVIPSFAERYISTVLFEGL